MAQATPQQVIQKVSEELDDSITDPNSDRRQSDSSNRWIYNIPINFDVAAYPRIHLETVSSIHDGLSIGSTERYQTHRFQISIFHGTGQGNEMDVDDDGEREPVRRVLDYIADRVITVVNDNQSVWRGLGDGDNVYSVLTVEEQRIQDTKNSVMQHVIDCEIQLSR